MGMTDDEVAIHDQLNALRVQVKSIEASKVVLIGDIILDRYIHGYANNLNSNAPVPVLTRNHASRGGRWRSSTRRHED